jgi:hypothetical protein
MPVSKYEIRSEEVQQLMSRPPHLLILWGNTFLLVLVIASLFLLNRFSLPVYRSVPVAVTTTHLATATIDLRAASNAEFHKMLQFPVRLDINGKAVNDFTITKVTDKDTLSMLISLQAHSARDTPAASVSFPEGAMGTMRIKIAERHIIDILKSHFRSPF